MKAFNRFSIIATGATYFLIFVGGLVRVSGAGLGCPDWPKCFGRWIPPLHINQLPPGFNPADFNFTLAWIEYINRLVGMTVGTLIAIVGFWAIIKFRKYPRILIPSILAAILVAYQGWQGSQVVASELKPIIVTVHMGLAFVITALMTYVSTESYLISRTEPIQVDKALSAKWIKTLVIGLFILLQVILGTQVREGIEIALRKFPLADHMRLMGEVGMVGHIHAVVGILIAAGALFLGFILLSRGAKKISLLWQSAWIIIMLSILQITVGSVLYAFNLTQIMQVMHMWIACLMIGITLIIYSVLTYKPRQFNG